MSVETVSILGKEQIVIGWDIIDRIVGDTLAQLPSSTYVLISDTNIAQQAHFRALTAAFATKINADSKRMLEFLVAPGELSKTRETKQKIEDFMFSHSCTRDTVVLAVGGGVIGDMIGYVASTFMRGVPYVQIPTTLLAMVDSSIGGKTAVDVPNGKNLVGAFWQPALNFIDLRFLESLPKREFLNGMAEVIKTAAIYNAEEFSRLEHVNAEFMAAISQPRDVNGRVDLNSVRSALHALVRGSVSVKAEVVTLDEREGGLRNILNFGHSIGHAYEALLTPHVLHGECVAIGCVLEAELSRLYGYLSPAAVARLVAIFKAYELPISVKDSLVQQRSRNCALPVDKLLEIMAVDKKNCGKSKRIVLLKQIGETYEPRATSVPDEDIAIVLSDAISVSSYAPGVKKAHFTVTPPGSKSISNRVLVLCALATGTCQVTNLLHSDDTAVMLDALEQLGAAKITLKDGGNTLEVTGNGGKMRAPEQALFLNNAGTAARILTAVATLVPGKVRLTGNARMQERPIGALVDALRANGQQIDYVNRTGSLPLDLHATSRGLRGGRIELAATVSSQYVSALLIVAPYAREPVTLSLVGGKPISQFYIDMTVQMMRDFGIKVTKSEVEPHTYHIPCGTYQSPSVYAVESDASSATYPLAFAALTGTTCTVPTIGASSLQGDAKFAVDVLRPMGCAVEQTAHSTTVTGPEPGSLRGIVVDMEPMTDAFLTASVLAAVAKGTTKITGIANQHVKECDRIQAMHDQLAAFGVHSVPLPDGIDITGVELVDLKKPSRVLHAYDDHRVAMSLSLLATQVAGLTTIDERRCVEKTWPGWWDTLRTVLDVPLRGQSVEPPKSSAKMEKASIVLVGMRGAGKTTLGQTIAEVLKFAFVDLDAEFAKKYGKDVREFVVEKGWDAFREAESLLLQSTLAEHPQLCVIATGGGVVESAENRKLLQQFSARGLVVHVHRDLRDIQQLLTADSTRPQLGAQPDNVEEIYARREPFYHAVANRQFWAPRVVRVPLLRRMVTAYFAPKLPPIDVSARTYFLSLTFSNLNNAKCDWDEVLEGCTAVELRVDLLESQDLAFVSEQVALLRLRTDLPVIFTVRTQSQGGKFPDQNTEEYVALVKRAFELNVEYVDVELTQRSAHEVVQQLRAKWFNRTQVIMSHHDVQRVWDWENPTDWPSAFFSANRLGDIVKFVGVAKTTNDNFRLEEFRKSVAPAQTPFIGINMGQAGRLSRVLNQVLTPVTHPKLPVAAAPGQMSIKEINEVRAQLGMVLPQKFFVAGEPISHSQSPSLHMSAFNALGLPHTYELLETSDVDVVKNTISRWGDQFGGASVTIPLKERVADLCISVSPEAQAIGAINCLINTPRGILGANTDWIGIEQSFVHAGTFGGTHALVVGAGGTALAAVYAFYRLGYRKVYVLNRTASKVATLANRFASLVEVEAVTMENADKLQVNAVLSCIPGDREAPTELMTHLRTVLTNNKGVLVDAAYKPRVTPVLALAKELGWHTVEGRQMLVWQGIAQQQLWTGFAPVSSSHRGVN